MSFVVSQLGREIIEVPKLTRPELHKSPTPCRQCGGKVGLLVDRGENNEFETIKLGDIFTQFTQGQDSNNSSISTTSTPELCSQCLTVNSVSSLGDEPESQEHSFSYVTTMKDQDQPPSTTQSSIIISTATSVIMLQNSHNNNNEPLTPMYYEDKLDMVTGNGTSVIHPKMESAEEFILPNYVETGNSNYSDNQCQDMLTDSLDDHSELIIIKPGPGPEFHTQYTPPLSQQPNHNVQFEEIKIKPMLSSSSIIQNHLTSTSVPATGPPRPPAKIHSCDLCSKVFKNRRSAKAHQERVHDKLARYFCDTCGGAFSYRGSLNSHVASHHPPVVTFDCVKCGKKFKEKSSLSAHFTIVHSENPRKFKCEFCPSAFSKKVNLNYHRKRKHATLLNASTTSPANLNSAMNTQFSATPSTGLNGTGPNFSNSTSAVATIVPGPRSEPALDSVSSIIESIASNTDIIPSVPPPPAMVNTEGEFKCDYCGKSFQFRNNLKAHHKTHTREKSYTCTQCDKSFVYKESLKNHMLLHSGQFPYNCNICNKKFRDRSNRRKHVKNVHKVQLPNGAPLPVSITSTEPLASISEAASTISYGNGGGITTTTVSYAGSLPSTSSNTSGPSAPPKRRRAKKAAAPVDPLTAPYSNPSNVIKSGKAGKRAKGKAAQMDDGSFSAAGVTSNSEKLRSVIVSPKTIASHDYHTHSPALPVTVQMPSSMNHLPSFNPHQQQPFEQRNIIVKAESNLDMSQDPQSLFMQQHSHQNVIVYPKHSVISHHQSHYYEQPGDGRCYQQPGPDVSMAPYSSYVSLMPPSQSTSVEPNAPGVPSPYVNQSGSPPNTSTPPYVNVGMLPPVSRHSARNSIDSPMDPLQQQYTSNPIYMTESLGNEAYSQFWSPPPAQPAPSSTQPQQPSYYVSTTTGDSGSRPNLTCPSYIPPGTTVPSSSSNNTISSSSSSSGYMYPDLTQSFDFNNF